MTKVIGCLRKVGVEKQVDWERIFPGYRGIYAIEKWFILSGLAD